MFQLGKSEKAFNEAKRYMRIHRLCVELGSYDFGPCES